MDIPCTGCGEIWDHYYTAREPGFERQKGAKAVITSCPSCKPDSTPPQNADIIRELGSVLGDDVDGLAAELEDFGLI